MYTSQSRILGTGEVRTRGRGSTPTHCITTTVVRFGFANLFRTQLRKSFTPNPGHSFAIGTKNICMIRASERLTPIVDVVPLIWRIETGGVHYLCNVQRKVTL